MDAYVHIRGWQRRRKETDQVFDLLARIKTHCSNNPVWDAMAGKCFLENATLQLGAEEHTNVGK